ncbi:MAG: TetR family transcriptional regulator, partial [Proteobacteria bacterium]|nr:TetR family transcriptional regulator [Pseudomonadota bacterium]
MTRAPDISALAAGSGVLLAGAATLAMAGRGDLAIHWFASPLAALAWLAAISATGWMLWRPPSGPAAGLALLGVIALGGLATLDAIAPGSAAGLGALGLWSFVAALGFLAWRAMALLSESQTDTVIAQRGLVLIIPAAFGFWLLYLWEITVLGFGVSPVLLPAPSAIGRALAANPGILAADFYQTFLKAVLSGYAMGCGAGFLVGVLVDRVPFLQRGLLPLHASVIEVDGKAVAFAAPSGSGKSTLLACLHGRGHGMLCDDLCIVEEAAGRFVVHASFPVLKLRGDAIAAAGKGIEKQADDVPGTGKYFFKVTNGFEPRSLPLAAIYFLEWSRATSPPTIRELPRFEAFKALAASIFYGALLPRMGEEDPLMTASAALTRSVGTFSFARPREFDTTQALDRAMRVFWAQGYDATSLCDLLCAMGLSKSSLYETFGSKHELYLAALDHYNRTVTATHVAAVIAA